MPELQDARLDETSVDKKTGISNAVQQQQLGEKYAKVIQWMKENKLSTGTRDKNDNRVGNDNKVAADSSNIKYVVSSLQRAIKTAESITNSNDTEENAIKNHNEEINRSNDEELDGDLDLKEAARNGTPDTVNEQENKVLTKSTAPVTWNVLGVFNEESDWKMCPDVVQMMTAEELDQKFGGNDKFNINTDTCTVADNEGYWKGAQGRVKLNI
jgi:hypothetical protein